MSLRKSTFLAAFMLAAGAMAQAPQYRVTIIAPAPSTLAGLLHSPVAINDNGWVVGYFSSGVGYNYQSFLYRPGQGTIDLGRPLPNQQTVYARDISNAGRIVGVSGPDFSGAETNSIVWSWDAGQFITYPQLVAGRPAQVGLTNNAGRVIGWANDGSFIGKKAAEYLPGVIRLLMPASPGYDDAIDINNNDVIMGTEVRGGYLWFPGAPDRFILPPPASNWGATLIALNDLNDIAGSAREMGHPEGSSAVVYLDGQWRFLPPGGRRNTATSINNRREVVGNSQDNTGGIGDHGWYWSQETGRLLLQDMITEPEGVYAVWIARDINEVGQIAATIADRTTGQSYGAILTPISGPVTCYANCDSSTTAPLLNVGDFTCFLQRFAAGESYANCDASTQAPVLNVGDFMCFLQRFAAGCP
jgi:probable HAF family extracellular repeat protein